MWAEMSYNKYCCRTQHDRICYECENSIEIEDSIDYMIEDIMTEIEEAEKID